MPGWPFSRGASMAGMGCSGKRDGRLMPPLQAQPRRTLRPSGHSAECQVHPLFLQSSPATFLAPSCPSQPAHNDAAHMRRHMRRQRAAGGVGGAAGGQPVRFSCVSRGLGRVKGAGEASRCCRKVYPAGHPPSAGAGETPHRPPLRVGGCCLAAGHGPPRRDQPFSRSCRASKPSRSSGEGRHRLRRRWWRHAGHAPSPTTLAAADWLSLRACGPPLCASRLYALPTHTAPEKTDRRALPLCTVPPQPSHASHTCPPCLPSMCAQDWLL